MRGEFLQPEPLDGLCGRHAVVVEHVVEDGLVAGRSRLDEVDTTVAVDVLEVAVTEIEAEAASAGLTIKKIYSANRFLPLISERWLVLFEKGS